MSQTVQWDTSNGTGDRHAIGEPGRTGCRRKIPPDARLREGEVTCSQCRKRNVGSDFDQLHLWARKQRGEAITHEVVQAAIRRFERAGGVIRRVEPEPLLRENAVNAMGGGEACG